MQNYTAEIDLNQGNIILMFSGAWCGDCIVVSMFIDQVVEQHPEYTFYKVDRDEHMELATQYNIFGIPSFVALENGQLIGDFISRDAKTKDEIENWIKNLK
ncbi:MAG: thioredoxin family protein [Mycoplasmatales bacterium]